MPFVHVSSSAARSNVDSSATKRAIAESAAKALDRPLPHVIVQLDLDQDMFAGESEEPCAFVHLRSIGRIDAERNPTTVSLLSETVAETLQLPLGRVFVKLEDIPASTWAMNGKTVA